MWYLAVVLFALTGLLTPAWAQTDVACHRCLDEGQNGIRVPTGPAKSQ